MSLRPIRLLPSCFAMLLLAPGLAAAQDESAPAPAPAAQPRPCTSPEHQQFDFWLGEWTVTNVQTGTASAVNRIRAAHGGCVLVEEYESGAYSGMSLNFWDAASERWRQTWIDNQGQPLRISGGLEDGSMVMRSEPGADGAVQRITWTPREDGTVRQHWEATKDGGDSWATVFDGVYSKKR